jgi:hypothetical protein
MESDLEYLFAMNQRYRLEHRSPRLRQFLPLLRRGLVKQRNALAKLLLIELQPIIDEMERRPNYLFRPPDFSELYRQGPPPLVIGHLEEVPDVPLGLFPQGAFHSLFVGTTGAGKTVGQRRLIVAVEELNRRRGRPIIIIVLDFKGHSFSDLAARFGPHWRYFDVHGALRLGLQPPVGVPAPLWINHITTSFCARAHLVAGWVTMANVMRMLVATMNSGPPDRPLFPDFQLLLDVLRALPRKAFAEKVQYLDSVVQVLEGVTQASGQLFSAFRGLDLEEDLIRQGQSAVISVPNLSPQWLNQFVADLLILQLLLGRISRRQQVGDPEVLLVLDDADDIVSTDNERLFVASMPPIVRALRLLREFGVGISLGIGALNPVSEQILNSIGYHFVFCNPHDSCIEVARRSLGLPQGSQGIVRSLRKGECVVHMPGEWPSAFLAEIDACPADREVSPRNDTHPHVPAKQLSNMPEVLAVVQNARHEQAAATREARAEDYAELRPESRDIIYFAGSRLYWPFVRLAELMDTPPTPAVREEILQELRAGGYADIEDVRVGRKKLRLLELLERAWQLLGRKPQEVRGRGKLKHRTFANWIVMVGRRRGYDAICEWTVPGTSHAADAAWRVDGVWETFEVVDTCDENLAEHANATFAPGSPVTKMTIVAAQKSELRQIEEHLASLWNAPPGRIEFVPIEVFGQELWPS